MMQKMTAEADGRIVSSLNLRILENDDPAHDCRPFAVIDNVRTEEAHRRRGYAAENLKRAERIARDAGCCKIMLCTSSRDEGVRRLYAKAGYDGEYKTCYCKAL